MVHTAPNTKPLQDLFKRAVDYASFIIRESAQLGPSILISATDGSHFFLTGDTSDDLAKDRFVREARLACIAYGAEAVVFVSEAWMSRRLSKRPSESPDREEIVILLGEAYESNLRKLFRVLRSESGPVVSIVECADLPLDQAKGRFTNILPLRRPTAEHQAQAKKLLAELGVSNRVTALAV